MACLIAVAEDGPAHIQGEVKGRSAAGINEWGEGQNDEKCSCACGGEGGGVDAVGREQRERDFST